MADNDFSTFSQVFAGDSNTQRPDRPHIALRQTSQILRNTPSNAFDMEHQRQLSGSSAASNLRRIPDVERSLVGEYNSGPVSAASLPPRNPNRSISRAQEPPNNREEGSPLSGDTVTRRIHHDQSRSLEQLSFERDAFHDSSHRPSEISTLERTIVAANVITRESSRARTLTPTPHQSRSSYPTVMHENTLSHRVNDHHDAQDTLQAQNRPNVRNRSPTPTYTRSGEKIEAGRHRSLITPDRVPSRFVISAQELFSHNRRPTRHNTDPRRIVSNDSDLLPNARRSLTQYKETRRLVLNDQMVRPQTQWPRTDASTIRLESQRARILTHSSTNPRFSFEDHTSEVPNVTQPFIQQRSQKEPSRKKSFFQQHLQPEGSQQDSQGSNTNQPGRQNTLRSAKPGKLKSSFSKMSLSNAFKSLRRDPRPPAGQSPSSVPELNHPTNSTLEDTEFLVQFLQFNETRRYVVIGTGILQLSESEMYPNPPLQPAVFLGIVGRKIIEADQFDLRGVLEREFSEIMGPDRGAAIDIKWISGGDVKSDDLISTVLTASDLALGFKVMRKRALGDYFMVYLHGR